MRPLAERTALVTGCSSGLGRVIATHLVAKNWRVFATARGASDLDELDALGLLPVRIDLRDSESIQSAATHVLERCGGRLGALVNNAGYTQFGAVEDLTRAEIREQFETNVFGAVELTNAFLPSFRRNGHGKIVFISSVCGRFSIPYFGSYCASKFALEAFADALRRETRGSGVGVQVIEPGLFKTRGFERTVRSFEAEAGARGSIHAQAYERTLKELECALSAIPEDRNAMVAKLVEDLLEGRRGQARSVVPRAALVYEAAHRFFPDRLQDLLVAWRARRAHRRV